MSKIWDLRARLYDVCEGSDLRRGPAKADLFRHMRSRALFVAVGTGLEIKRFPPGLEIVGIDISEAMLRRAEPRARRYPGPLRLLQMDAAHLGFADASFDTVVTSCTMCSVPYPVRALQELYRVLRPGGSLLMFEHVRSRNPVFGLALDLMTLWTRLSGTEMNRNTVQNVVAADFRIMSIESAYLDIVLAIRGTKDAPQKNHTQCEAQRGPRGLTHALTVR
jgi:ubiquinone/menaquinone biosynthesis C-methylase UbiE